MRSNHFWEKGFFDESISPSMLEHVPWHLKKLFKKIDALIQFEFIIDLEMRLKAPKERVDAATTSYYKLMDILKGTPPNYKDGKKVLYVGWPAQKLAEAYNVSYKKYKEILVGGINVSSSQLQYKAYLFIQKFFQNAVKIYVSDEDGTKFNVNVKGRPIERDVGLITDEDIGKGILSANLPAGEIAYPIHETKGEGVIVCPIVRDLISKVLVRNLKLEFRHGKLLLDKISADNDVDKILSSFEFYTNLDLNSNISEIRTLHLAELGMGINPAITEVIGRLISDEKVSGTVHVAFGENDTWGGTSQSNMHWDFVTAPKENITVQYEDGSQKQVMEKGKWIK